MFAINLSKQQILKADPRAIQQISFTGNLEHDEDTQMSFIHEKAKESILESFVNVFYEF